VTPTSVTIPTAERAIELMQQVAHHHGHGYRYAPPGSGKTCRYFELTPIGEWKPGCIVGEVIWNLGYRPIIPDGYDEDPIEGNSALDLLDGVINTPDDQVGYVLITAQRVQDDGGTHDVAVQTAREVLHAYRRGQGAIAP